MDTENFKRELGELGFNEVLTRTWPAHQFVDMHTHSFEVRALVLDGELALGVDGQTKLLRAGDIFTLDPNRAHTERYGPQGATFLVGRKHTA